MKALITGITGQDGSYLAEFLLSKNYQVHGLVRRSSVDNLGRISHILSDIELHRGNLADGESINSVICSVVPDEIYNLGAQSDVFSSFHSPNYTAQVNGLSVDLILGAMKRHCPHCKLYQASTSELYGNANESPQNEQTAFSPNSPYAVAKLHAYWSAVNYRNSFGIYAANGILFNHESPRRGLDFVTKKIAQGMARIYCKDIDVIYLGDLNSCRDWGFAPDYVEAMWMILQQPMPDDFVVATGVSHSVREFCEESAKLIGYELRWKGVGVDEIGYDNNTGKILVKVDPRYYRPSDIHNLLGDITRAKEILKWSPKTTFEQLVEKMVSSELDILQN